MIEMNTIGQGLTPNYFLLHSVIHKELKQGFIDEKKTQPTIPLPHETFFLYYSF